MSIERAAADPLEGALLRCLVGSTATGKSALAQVLAERTGAEIVSLDSMLVYRGMDIGTAKPELRARARVPHHMLDLVAPAVRYDVTRFLDELRVAVADVVRRGTWPLFVGGTAFYLKSLVHGLFAGPPVNPGLRARIERELTELGNERMHALLSRLDAPSAERIHPNDTRRLVRALEVHEQTGRPLSEWQREWGWHGAGPAKARPRRIVGLRVPDALLTRRIAERTRAMLAAGWAEEVSSIRASGGFGPTAIQALGYREVIEHARGELALEDCEQRIVTRTRRFSRRQATWYRRFEEIEWIEVGADDHRDGALVDRVLRALDP